MKMPTCQTAASSNDAFHWMRPLSKKEGLRMSRKEWERGVRVGHSLSSVRRWIGARPRATDARENSEAWPMRWSQGRYQLRRLPKHDLVGYKGPPIDDNDDCQCLLRRIVAASAMAYASRYTGLIA